MLKMIKSWAVWCVECAALLLLSMLLTTLYLLRAPVGWLSRACSRDRRDAGGTRVPQFGQTEDAAQAIVVMAGTAMPEQRLRHSLSRFDSVLG